MNPPVAITETHSAVVALVGDRAYKWKKPVDLGFLDFSTVEARAEACRREYELNVRYAPDVYLGTATVTGDDGAPCEHLVVMRRLPDERRLATIVERGEDVTDALREVVERAVTLHAAGAPPPAASGWGGPDALAANWRDNIEVLHRTAGGWVEPDEIERAGELAMSYIEGRRGLLEERRRAHVRDGHGDLQAADVFVMPDGVRILDRLDFDDAFRHVDALDEIAFLAMDLERLGRPALAARALSHYRAVSGDRAPESLAQHYLAYRAHVRAKVEAIRAQQGDAGAGPRALLLHAMALEHLERGRVLMILVGGGPGTGKSTLAEAIADELGADVVRSDEVRKELVGVSVGGTRVEQDRRRGMYGPRMTRRTYRALIDRASALARSGTSIVVDATWADAGMRAEAASAAGDAGALLIELRCDTPAEHASTRVAEREQRYGSDATPEVARMLAIIDPWPTARVIDTSGPAGRARAQALAAIAEAMRP